MDPRYRQVGYGEYHGTDGMDLDWRAVWLDTHTIQTGSVLFYIFPDGKNPTVHAGTIYRTLADVPALHR